MTSHLHMLARTDGEPMSNIMRDFQKFTATKLIEELNQAGESRREWMLRLFCDAGSPLKRITNYKVWQDGNHPILLTKRKFVWQKLEYIHNNPVVEEIVAEPAHYLNSSARDYEGGKGYLEVVLLQ